MKLFGGNGSGKDKNRYTSDNIQEDWPEQWFEEAGHQRPTQPKQQNTQQRQRPPQEPPRPRPVQENYQRPPQRPVQENYQQRPVQRPVQDNYRQRPVQEKQQRQTRRQYPDYPDYYEDEYDSMRGGRTVDDEPPKKKGRAGRAVLTVFLVLALLCGVVFAYWKISTKPPDNQVQAPDNDDPVTVDKTNDDAPTYQEERYYTLLVVGDDQEGGNTDTIMLVRFDTQELQANVVSIPRDTIVNIPQGNKKINSVFHNAEGDGMTALMDEIENISGIRPNNYIMVDTDVFIDVVDAMGGVEFYVPFKMSYDDYSGDYVFTIHVEEGLQTLDGYDALGVFRWRQNNSWEGGHVYANPDIDRIEMQHNLLMAIAEKAMSTRNVATLMNIATSVLDKCETDLTIGNIQWYMEKFLAMSLDNVEFVTVPTTGAMVQGGGDPVAYVFINVDEWMETVNSKINPYGEEITKEDCTIIYWTETPTIYNGMYYADPDSLETTDGTPVDDNFYVKF